MDANAVVPYREESGRYIGRWVAGVAGERGEYLSRWALERRMRLVNTQFQNVWRRTFYRRVRPGR